MNFLVDANLPATMVSWLGTGVDQAAYVDELLAPGALDGAIWELARSREMIVVSKDADFAVRAMRERSVQVVWIRCGNMKLRPFEA
ncbi:MAG: DUF5615 family PIN-like protein [Hyphomonadaceae bacterium]